MTKRDKAAQRIMSIPIKLDISFSEVENFLISNGFIKEAGVGDHVVFRHPNLIEHLSIPCGGKSVKPIYIKFIQKAIKSLN